MELFFWNERGTMVSIMSVPVIPGTTFDFGTAQTVIQGRDARPSTDTQYDVGPGGRFLLLKPLASSTGNEIVIVQNWFEDLKRLVPRN